MLHVGFELGRNLNICLIGKEVLVSNDLLLWSVILKLSCQQAVRVICIILFLHI
jgi:hypothetical protein